MQRTWPVSGITQAAQRNRPGVGSKSVSCPPLAPRRELKVQPPLVPVPLHRMMKKFTDPRLRLLNNEEGFDDNGMRLALGEALEPGEIAIASYSVSAHIWVQAVLTDRALLLVKGAVRAKVTRVPFPLEIMRAPVGGRKGVRVQTPLGKKTLWGSKLDAEARLLLNSTQSTNRRNEAARGASAQRSRPSMDLASKTEVEIATASRPDAEPAGSPRAAGPARGARATRQARRLARQAAGPAPRRPRRRRVRRQRVGFAPHSTIWDMADNCVKCGRPLTDPRSRQARVGTRCIRIYGSQQRRIPNPKHAAWIDAKTKADVAYTAEKVRADAEFAGAKAAYEKARAEWARVRSAR